MTEQTEPQWNSPPPPQPASEPMLIPLPDALGSEVAALLAERDALQERLEIAIELLANYAAHIDVLEAQIQAGKPSN